MEQAQDSSGDNTIFLAVFQTALLGATTQTQEPVAPAGRTAETTGETALRVEPCEASTASPLGGVAVRDGAGAMASSTEPQGEPVGGVAAGAHQESNERSLAALLPGTPGSQITAPILEGPTAGDLRGSLNEDPRGNVNEGMIGSSVEKARGILVRQDTLGVAGAGAGNPAVVLAHTLDSISARVNRTRVDSSSFRAPDSETASDPMDGSHVGISGKVPQIPAADPALAGEDPGAWSSADRRTSDGHGAVAATGHEAQPLFPEEAPTASSAGIPGRNEAGAKGSQPVESSEPPVTPRPPASPGPVQVLRMTLDPPSMGPMHVRLRVSGQSVRAVFVTENAEAKAVLENGFPQLRDNLADKGLAVHSLTAHVGTEGRSPDHTPRQHPWSPPSSLPRDPEIGLEPDAEPAVGQGSARTGASGLDLRI